MKKMSLSIIFMLSIFTYNNTYAIDFGNTNFNLTKNEVKTKVRKNDKAKQETNDSLVYVDKVNNLICSQIFNFEKNKLSELIYKFENFKDIDECEELYNKVITDVKQCHESNINDIKKRYKQLGMEEDMIESVLSVTDGFFICNGNKIIIDESCKANNTITITNTNFLKGVK